MNGHFLIKIANMLHRICPTIIKREGRLIKSPRKACTLNPSCERRFSNLVSFMTLFPRPLCDVLLLLRLWLLYSSSPEKVSLGGVLDHCLYMASSASSKEDSDPSDDRLRRARRNFFFNSSTSRCMSLSFFAWETWLFPRDWLLLVCVVCPLPSW